MRRSDFVDFLVNTGLEPSASSTRANWCRKVEELYSVDLDLIVTDKEKILDLIENIMLNTKLSKHNQTHFPNGIRKYYEFSTGAKIGTLKENNRR